MDTDQGIRRSTLTKISLSLWVSVALYVAAGAQAPAQSYYPPAGQWARKAPAEVGMDAAKLDAAIAFAKTRETNMPRDFSTQEKIFGSLLGPIHNRRATTNGLIIRNGYIVAELCDTNSIDTS